LVSTSSGATDRERSWRPFSAFCLAGLGDPAAPKTFCLPLLPSGPGGVHRVLLHRAQPLFRAAENVLRRRSRSLMPLDVPPSRTPRGLSLPAALPDNILSSLIRNRLVRISPFSISSSDGTIPFTTPVRIPRSLHRNTYGVYPVASISRLRVEQAWYGGEGGIRTHGPVAETHAFQACRFVHSRTSPQQF
jgi:hypothetical protein